MISIYTDGACSGNPGPGGYGVVAFDTPNHICFAYNDREQETTNNREEMKAIIKALNFCEKNKEETYFIYSDSAYCVNMINEWIWGWYLNGWKRSKNKEIENLDLVKQLYDKINTPFFKHQIKVVKVKGHSDNMGNRLADLLATNKTDVFEHIAVKEGFLEAPSWWWSPQEF